MPLVDKAVYRDKDGHIIIEHLPNRRPFSRYIDDIHSLRDADRIADVDRADRVGDVDRHNFDYKGHIIKIPRGEKFFYRDEEGEYREHILPYHFFDEYEDRIRS